MAKVKMTIAGVYNSVKTIIVYVQEARMLAERRFFLERFYPIMYSPFRFMRGDRPDLTSFETKGSSRAISD